MPEEFENTVQDPITAPAASGNGEETLQVFTPEGNEEKQPEIKELLPAEPALSPEGERTIEAESALQKVASGQEEEQIPESFRKEEPAPLPLSESVSKPEEETPLLPLEGLEENNGPKLLKEQAPVLSGSSQIPSRKTTSFVRRTVSLSMECGGTLGELLTEARKKAGLTLEEVRELTKIRQENISAMENNKLEELPPAVFVSAYARTLQELYCLDAPSRERVTEATEKLLALNKKEEKNLSGEAQEMKNKILKEISSTVKVNLEEERKFRITAFCVLGGLILFFLLVTVLILFLIFGGKKESAGEIAKEVPPFRAENISTLIPAVVPEVQKMDLPKSPAGKRRR